MVFDSFLLEGLVISRNIKSFMTSLTAEANSIIRSSAKHKVVGFPSLHHNSN